MKQQAARIAARARFARRKDATSEHNSIDTPTASRKRPGANAGR